MAGIKGLNIGIFGSRFTVGKSSKSFAISTSIGKHCICDQNHESENDLGYDVHRFVMTQNWQLDGCFMPNTTVIGNWTRYHF